MKFGPPTNSDRVKAQYEGRKTYQGKPCKNCSTTEKYVENYLCCECARTKARLRAQTKRANRDSAV